MQDKKPESKKFIIEYDYFGLLSSAEVKKTTWKAEPYYKCFLHSSAEVISIKKINEEIVTYWIDMSAGCATPLSQILGQAIENKTDH